jgi:hypothetical protein
MACLEPLVHRHCPRKRAIQYSRESIVSTEPLIDTAHPDCDEPFVALPTPEFTGLPAFAGNDAMAY